MKIALIPESGKFYKVNMHCHTNISDGKNTPQEIKEMYKAAGYSAVCFTDHEAMIGHGELCDEDFIALHGYEVAIKQDELEHTGNFMKVYHFNIIAPSADRLEAVNYYLSCRSCPGNSKKYIEEFARYKNTIDHTEYDTDWINAYFKDISDAGFLVTYNHPGWSLQDARDYAGLRTIHAVEVINGTVSADATDNTAIPFETILREGVRVVPVGGDDNHSPMHVGRAWTMVKAEELSYESLIEAYRKGDCYASDGPEIKSLFIEDGKIKIETSPAVRINILTEGRYAKAVHGCDLTFAEFDYLPEKFGKFFRLEVRDEKGHCAFSGAYYTGDINV